MPEYEIDMAPDLEKIMVVGDWHHHSAWASYVLAEAKKMGVDTIIQVGDLGYWPLRGGTFFSSLMNEVSDLGLRFYWLEGNHESVDQLTPGKSYGPLQHLPRGFRWQWWDKTWMSVGGGVSVDKHWRTPGLDWFPEETLSLAEATYCARPGEVDIILSHDCPDQVDIPGLGEHAGWYPADAIAESEGHRAVLGEICDAVRPDLLIHGHLHINHITDRESSGTRVIGLDRDGTSLDESTHLLTPELVVDPAPFIEIYRTSPGPYRGRSRPWRFRVRDAGGQVIVKGTESYDDRTEAIRDAGSVAPGARVVEV